MPGSYYCKALEFYDNAFCVLDYVDSSTATIHKLDTSGNLIDSSQIGIGSYSLGMTQKDGYVYVAEGEGTMSIKKLGPVEFFYSTPNIQAPRFYLRCFF
jgi:hypothetical protein